MTRAEFDADLNATTVLGLQQKKLETLALRGLAKGYQRPDIAEVLTVVIDASALAIAIAIAEQMGVTPEELS